MLSALLALSLAHADPGFQSTLQRADAGVVQYYWIPDLAITSVSLGGLAWLHAQGPLDPGGVAEPRGIDLPETPRWSPTAAALSDFFGHPGKLYGANLPVLSALGVGVYGGLRNDSAAAGAVWTLTAVEAVSVNLLVTELIKVTVSRPRPYTALAFQQAWPEAYRGETLTEDLSEEGHYDAYKSFPSGHTSASASASFAVATLLWRDLRSRGAEPWVAGLTFGGATAIAATTGTLRVVAGYHHPTDVIAGGLLGAGVGVGTVLLHTREPGAGPRAALSASGAGAPMLSFGGSW